MMLDHLGEAAAAAALMSAIERVVREPALHTADIGGYATTTEVTKAVVGFIAGQNTLETAP
jgi:tartrate dehydrogenase/decarboxylase / D-malate dehydrogenase